MTTEEKAKAYDEALEAARKELKQDLHESGIWAIQRIFPELRESEDERIRKLLVWQVYRNIEDETNDLAQSVYDGIKGHDPDLEESIEDWKKCLAWLEKQKEQKPNFDTHWENGSMVCEQKEQKPAEKQDYSGLSDLERVIHRGFLCAGLENVPVTIIKETAQDCLNRMKTAEWSDEDRDRVAQYLHDKDGGMLWSKATEIAIDILDILRPQPKQEWNKEDERNRDRAIFYTRFYQRNEGTTKGSEECIDWLKSLRPQPKDEIFKEKDEAFKLGKHQLALSFMNYLDENRPEGKMGLSNSECEDIDKAFKENNWEKIIRYANKYSWKPSGEQMEALLGAEGILRSLQYNDRAKILAELYEQLKKLI